MENSVSSPTLRLALDDIRRRLKSRLTRLGPIRTDEIWMSLKESYSYEMVGQCLRLIMAGMVAQGKADVVRNGVWFIHKNNYCHVREQEN